MKRPVHALFLLSALAALWAGTTKVAEAAETVGCSNSTCNGPNRCVPWPFANCDTDGATYCSTRYCIVLIPY